MKVDANSARRRSATEAVTAHLSDGRARTVAEICSSTGLARSTVVHALERLAGEKVVHRLPPERSRRGRPSSRWSIVESPGLLAVVVASAHGLVAGVAHPKGDVLSVAEAVSNGGPPSSDMVLSLVDDVLEEAGVTPDDLDLAVVGLPGASRIEADPNAAYLKRFRLLDGQPADTVVSRHLRCRVVVENDANLGALGEATAGAGAGLDTVLFASLTHGTGSGLVIRGRLHRGSSGLAGEIGHLHTRDDGLLCECGARGCFWQTVSIPSLLAELAEAHGRLFTVEEISEAAESGALDITRALSGFGHALGRRLADAVVFIDPDAIVIDSVLGAAASVIADGVREAVGRFAPPAMSRSTLVTPGTLGAAAFLQGAVALVRIDGANRFSGAPHRRVIAH